MTSATDFPTFIRLVTAEFGTIPKAGLAMIGVVSAASAAAEIYLWTHGSSVTAADYVIGAGLFGGWAAVVYAVSMMMAGSRVEIVGFAKYMATAFAAVLPMLAALGLLLLFMVLGAGGLALIMLAPMFASLIPIMLLPGWPILQATSSKLVGPAEALRLTKGYRWPLILAGFALGAINRAVPTTSATDELTTVCLLAVVGGVASAISAMLGLSISIAAWRLMTAGRGVPAA